MARIGYARVSTIDQDLDIQLAKLKAEGCAIIRSEKVPGGSREGRAELATVLEFLRRGDELVVTRLDRLGRDTRDVLNLIHDCEQRGAFLTVIDPQTSRSCHLCPCRPSRKLLSRLLTLGGRFAYPKDGDLRAGSQGAVLGVVRGRGFVDGLLHRDKPMLGICAGMQMLACLNGCLFTPDLRAKMPDAPENDLRGHQYSVRLTTGRKSRRRWVSLRGSIPTLRHRHPVKARSCWSARTIPATASSRHSVFVTPDADPFTSASEASRTSAISHVWAIYPESLKRHSPLHRTLLPKIEISTMFTCEVHRVQTFRSSPKPVPAKASRATISAYAEDIAYKLGFQIGNTLEPIVARLGGIIEHRDPIYVDSNASESIMVRSGNDFTIYLGTMTSPERDRFTLAHELGHLFIHYPLTVDVDAPSLMIATRWVDDNDDDQRRAEWEANWFASAFLMPGCDFARCAKQMDLNELAMTFSVSYSAAEMRKTSLGIT